MNRRERTETALNRRKPDRCPMQISCTPEFRSTMKSKFSIENDPSPYALEQVLGVDMLITSVGWMNSYYQEKTEYTDEWGVQWKAAAYETPFGTGRYTEVQGNPLSDEAAIADYRPPDPHRESLYKPAKTLIEAYKKDYWIVGAVKTTIFECAWALRGFEQLLMDLLINPDIARAVLSIPYRYHLEAAKQLVCEGVDMIWIGDDVGSQRGMLLSPDTWRSFLKPLMADFISELRSCRSDIYIAYHSDGSVEPIIPDLVEIGLDVLNPIQPNCMDIEGLKKNFGTRLSFWGGIDQQDLLPFASPNKVYHETKRIISILGDGGGYIAGPTHNLQLDVPAENLLSMIRAIQS